MFHEISSHPPHIPTKPTSFHLPILDVFEAGAIYQYIYTSYFATVQSDCWCPDYLVVKYFYLSTAYDTFSNAKYLWIILHTYISSPLERIQHCNFLLLSDLEKKWVSSDELCAIFWEFLHWHIFWTERICSPSSYSWAFNRLQMWRSIALLKYDLQLHLIHFPPFHEIEMDGWANLKNKCMWIVFYSNNIRLPYKRMLDAVGQNHISWILFFFLSAVKIKTH